MALQPFFVLAHPGTETRELAGAGTLQIAAAILRMQFAVSVQREAEVGTIEFFLNDNVLCQHLVHLMSEEHFVTARLVIAKPDQMMRVRKTKEFSHDV
jgi:hypothetical protein